MLKRATPEKVIHFTWLFVAVTFCWPSPSNSSKSQHFRLSVMQIISIIHAILLIVPSIYSLRVYISVNDMMRFYRCLLQLIACIQIVVQTSICFVKHDSLQRIVEEMITCINEAKEYERDIFDLYIAKCHSVYSGYVTTLYSLLSFVVVGAFFLPIPHPLSVVYPFRDDYIPVNFILYLHHTAICCQGAGHFSMCVFGALLMWFTAARFDCLAIEFERTTNIRTLITCIKKQLHLKRYTEEVINCFRFMVIYILAISTCILAGCGILLITDAPMIAKVKFLAISTMFLFYIYMYAWPADHIQDVSLNVLGSTYNIKWYDHSLEMQKQILTILGYKKPTKLSIACLMPELTLRFFCSFVSNALSFCTALRAMVQDEPE